jgi:hypothetical protein
MSIVSAEKVRVAHHDIMQLLDYKVLEEQPLRSVPHAV